MARKGPAAVKTAKESTVEVPDFESLGPAMRALTESQRAFCIAYFGLGAQKGAGGEAARQAGFGGTEVASRVAAMRLLRLPHVREALHELAVSYGATKLKIKAMHKLSALLNCGNETVELNAAKTILDRTGIVSTTEHHVLVEHDTRTNEQLIAYIESARAKLALLPKPIEGEFAVVEQSAEAT